MDRLYFVGVVFGSALLGSRHVAERTGLTNESISSDKINRDTTGLLNWHGWRTIAAFRCGARYDLPAYSASAFGITGPHMLR